jgi:hypothetical protein
MDEVSGPQIAIQLKQTAWLIHSISEPVNHNAVPGVGLQSQSGAE